MIQSVDDESHLNTEEVERDNKKNQITVKKAEENVDEGDEV